MNITISKDPFISESIVVSIYSQDIHSKGVSYWLDIIREMFVSDYNKQPTSVEIVEIDEFNYTHILAA